MSVPSGRSVSNGSTAAGRPSRLIAGWQRLRDAAVSPQFVTDLIQIAKSVVAATGAWWFTVNVLESSLPFLAPWTAVLTVQATAHRSLSRGAQTSVASAVGVGVSFLVGYFLGVSIWTFGLAILVGLAAARISWIRDEGAAIATTAIFVLGSGFDDQAPLLGDRLLEVGLGVGAGIVVNVLLIPPLRDRQASRYVDSVNRRMGDVLISVAEELTSSWSIDRANSWVDETYAIRDEIESAYQIVRFARESARTNPRSYLPAFGRGQATGSVIQRVTTEHQVGYEDIIPRLDEGNSHLRHLTRVLRQSTYSQREWDENFREQWVAIVRDTGYAIKDPAADVLPIYERLTGLTQRFSGEEGLIDEQWPVYGSLITNLRLIIQIVDDIATDRPARDTDQEASGE